jgi:hypothetical protein
MQEARNGQAGIDAGGMASATRRRFLGAGIACGGSWLLGGTLGGAVRGSGRAPAAHEDDPVLAHVLEQTIAVYRTATSRPRGRGEDLRAMAANLGLTVAYMRSKGLDEWVDAEVARRAGELGDQAFAAELLRSHDRIRANMSTGYGVELPKELLSDDPGRLALLVAPKKHGVMRATFPKLRRPMEAFADQIDARRIPRASTSLRPVSVQKPGDDFGGFPEPNWAALRGFDFWGCGEWKQYGELLGGLASEIGVVALLCAELPGCTETLGIVAGALAGAAGLVLYFVGQFCRNVAT